jgi:hypothetical protein
MVPGAVIRKALDYAASVGASQYRREAYEAVAELEAERDALREDNKKLRVLLDEVGLDRAGIAGRLSAAEKLLERHP